MNNKIEKLFLKIYNKYEDKQAFFQNIINYERSELKRGIVNMKIDINNFEKKYSMSNEIFSNKFETGELGDEEDFMIWAGINEMLIKNEIKLSELE